MVLGYSYLRAEIILSVHRLAVSSALCDKRSIIVLDGVGKDFILTIELHVAPCSSMVKL